MARRSRKSEYIIEAKVDSTDLASGIAKVTSEFGDLEKKGKEAFEGATDKAGGFISKLGGSEDTVSKFGEIGSKAFGGIDKALGGLPSGFAGALKGIKGANGGFKAMKGAIASTGIGLLVIALGELISYLMESKTFTDLMNQALLRIKAVIKPTVDLVMSLGSALGALFSGNPGEAFDIASEAVGGYGKALYDAQINVSALNKAQKELEKLQKEGNLLQAQANLKAHEANRISRDRTKSDKERLEALNDIRDAENESLNIDIRKVNLEKETLTRLSQVQKLTLDQQARMNELKVESLELLQKQREIQWEFEDDAKDIEEDRLDREQDARDDRQDRIDDQKEKDADILEAKRELLAELEYLRKTDKEQELFDAKELYDERVAIAGDDAGLLKSALRQYVKDTKAIEEEFQAQADADQLAIDEKEAQKFATLTQSLMSQEEKERARLKTQYDALLLLADEYGTGRAELEEKYSKEIEGIDKKYAVKTVELAEKTNAQKAKFALSAVSALVDFNRTISEDSEANAKRRFEVDKKLGIASATINTSLAISDALAKDSVAPFSRYVSAGMAGLQGLAQVIAIKRSTFDSPEVDDSGGVEGGNNGAGTINEAPQLDLDFLGAGAGQAGVQAYVVSSQMSNSQQAQQQIQDQASLVS